MEEENVEKVMLKDLHFKYNLFGVEKNLFSKRIRHPYYYQNHDNINGGRIDQFQLSRVIASRKFEMDFRIRQIGSGSICFAVNGPKVKRDAFSEVISFFHQGFEYRSERARLGILRFAVEIFEDEFSLTLHLLEEGSTTFKIIAKSGYDDPDDEPLPPLLPAEVEISFRGGEYIGYVDSWDLELIRFDSGDIPEKVVSTNTKHQRKERFEYCQKIVHPEKNLVKSVEIPLRDESVSIYKPLLLLSKFSKADKTSRIDIPSESVVMDAIVHLIWKNVQLFEPEEIVNYFLFFKGLGLLRELIGIANCEEFVFKECYTIFKQVVEEHENVVLKSWFDGEVILVDDFTKYTFKTSLALGAFNRMKKLMDDVDDNPELLTKKGMGNILYHLKKYENIVDIVEHEDLRGFDEMENDFSVSCLYRRLRGGELADITIVTNDGVRFRSHLYFLVRTFNFFMGMLRFPGQEFEQFIEKKTLNLEKVDSQMFNVMLDFMYSKEEDYLSIKETQVDVLLSVILHAHIFDDQALYSCCLEKMRNLLYVEKAVIEEALDNVGYKIYGNQEVIGRVIAILRYICICTKNISEERIRELIRKSNDRHVLKEQNKKILQMLHRLSERVDLLEKKPFIGTWEKRKRSDVDEENSEKEKENPKKKRKTE